MLFIVKGEVSVSHYMAEGDPEVRQVMHPVEADDEWAARKVFKKHYEDQTSEYSVYYSAHATDVFETLGIPKPDHTVAAAR